VADPLISLDTEHFSAQPGDEVRVTVTVTNLEAEVEGYKFEVLGPLAPYAGVVPPDVSVYPKKEETATLVFSLPTGTGGSGGLQLFGVLAQSTVHEQVSAVAEGDIDIAQVVSLQTTINPVRSTGRWRGHHAIRIRNVGNAPAQLQMKAYDENAALRFYLRGPNISVSPGQTTVVGLSVGTKHPYLRGPQRQLPFQVVGEPRDAEPGPPPAAGMAYGGPSQPILQAGFDQKPILSKGVITVLALLLAGIIALVAYALISRNVKDENLLPADSPPKPQRFAATTAGSDSVKLTWAAVDPAQSYELQHLDPKTGDVTKVDHLEGSLTSSTVAGLAPNAQACFKLRAINKGLPGQLSEMACARTAPQSPSTAPSTATPNTATPSTATPSTATPNTATPNTATPSTAGPSTPAGSITPDGNIMKQKWIAVAAQLPQSATEAGAQQKVMEVADKLGSEVRYLNTRNYPRLFLASSTPLTEPLFLIYIDHPFATRAEAESECEIDSKHTGDCVAAQPDPP
jgi:hypothetical protein